LPSLLVREIGCKSRGLVTKKAVKAGELLILANPFASVTAKDFNATGRLRSRRRRQPGASLAEEDDNIAVGAGDEVFPMRFKSLSITGHVATEFFRSLSQSRPSLPFLD
jgi:hypothetical protein